jgi:carbon monoxide dehydrogenase subunit G
LIEHTVWLTVEASIAQSFGLVRDMANWAAHMPGYVSFEIVNDRESVWVLKVGFGALRRTVRVRVRIEDWREPDHVAFSYRVDDASVTGSGHYDAHAVGGVATGMELAVRIVGEGPMSPVWEGHDAARPAEGARRLCNLLEGAHRRHRRCRSRGRPEYCQRYYLIAVS